MVQLTFSDGNRWKSFLPLTFTKPISELRTGILSFSERWQRALGLDKKVTFLTEDYLQRKYPAPGDGPALMILPYFLPSEDLIHQILQLEHGEALVYQDEIIAAHMDLSKFSLDQIKKMTEITEPLIEFSSHTDLFTYAAEAIAFDFKLLTQGKISQPIPESCGLIGDPADVFIEEGASLEFAILNAKTGKIYIGKDAEVMEGCMLRGPIALGDHSKFNLGSKVYGPTSIGPHCKVGGEVNNVVFQGYSNKGHDGFLGNSVIGEWCNLGADTNSSNLKNNYAEVKLWDFDQEKFQPTGLQFCGVIMGDHTKTAINTQLNTGTVTGVSANIFKPGFPPNHIPSFSWGGMKNDPKFSLEKCFEVAERAMGRRKVDLTDEDRNILRHIYEHYA